MINIINIINDKYCLFHRAYQVCSSMAAFTYQLTSFIEKVVSGQDMVFFEKA